MRTSELAARAAVNPQTLRYYERRGLLAAPARSPGGYRAYPDEAVRRVRFIKRAQDLGFTLAEVATLLHLAEGGPDSCDRARALAKEKITDLQRRIADLQALRAGLSRLVATCERPRTQRECPILHELDAAASQDSGGQAVTAPPLRAIGVWGAIARLAVGAAVAGSVMRRVDQVGGAPFWPIDALHGRHADRRVAMTTMGVRS